MTDTDTPIYARSDTMLGVCHGLGEELGIHANWLRIAAAVALFFNPVAVIVGYLTLGVLLAAFRWFFPFRQRRATDTAAAQPAVPLRGDNDDGVISVTEAA